MELDARKLKILQAIIDEYIMFASPVGSQTISARKDIGLSSATIRNEMAELEEYGFLEQPHTSAGRIPSDRAYRLYVNSIMRQYHLTADELAYIKTQLNAKYSDIGDIIKRTASVLSNITNLASVVLTPQLTRVKLRHIQLVPISDNKAVVFIVTDAGITRHMTVSVPSEIDKSLLGKLSEIMTERFYNRRLDEIKNFILPDMIRDMTEQRELLLSMLESEFDNLDSFTKTVEMSGANNLLQYPEYSNINRAKQLLNTMESKELLYNILENATGMEFTITIGSENKEEAIKDCSIVTATYRVSNEPIGSFGIIGPTRMDYSRILAILNGVGSSLSEILVNITSKEK